MYRRLQSYSEGRWHDGAGEARPLLDASTGEVVAVLAPRGPDPQGLLSYARGVGGPAIRSLSFHQRAALLKALAQHLRGCVDELVPLSARTGATRRDTAVDVDGGIATLAVYAGMATRSLPDSTFLTDGEIDPLGRGGTFAGRHLYTSRLGVAVQINAFNFPVWGMLEKLAPAFLAGMPSVVKPATQTAYLAEEVVRRIVDAGILPPGSISLLCGDPAGILDGLGPQDVVNFTGSAAVAARLRAHPTIVDRSVPFNAETDSLNCSILGWDVSTADPELALFVDQTLSEMTVKAGQKCTAIRRAFVPSPLIDAVVGGLTAAFDRVVIGDPSASATDMGPLASLEQREAVREAVGQLTGECRSLYGDPFKVDVVDADPQRGALFSPLLLRCDDPGASAPHRVEPFGPVSTILPYPSPEALVSTVALGQGSLVGSIVSHDSEVVTRLITDLAPWHGRLLVLDRDDAGESTGHGVAMPQMLHGGPGRAGGGEELGGLRAVRRHLRPVAIQGHPLLLERLAGG